MANLKGGSFERQIYDALYRTEARGQSRTGEARRDGLNHSHAIVDKREAALKDFAKFASAHELEGKLNQLMTVENISNFLQDRTANLKPSTVEGYISNFSAMVKGLSSKNISIPVAHERESFFQNQKDRLGRCDNKDYETGRYISPSQAVQIFDKVNQRSRAIVELQYSHGFRASEAIKIVNNPEKYINGNTISKVPGKGGQHYANKQISNELKYKILKAEEKISKDQYYRDINKVIGDSRPHDLRLSYAINHYQTLREGGTPHFKALKETSQELNHHRSSMTVYYQNRG